MRCLQCGKDLPLFKRLGRGAFCSEAHRREYQREYNVLALNLLARPKSPAEERGAPAVPVAVAAASEPVAVAATPERPHAPEMAEMVRFRSAPVAVRVVARITRDAAITPSIMPDRPCYVPAASCAELPNPNLIHLAYRAGIQDSATPVRERYVEARNFAPPDATVEVGLSLMDVQSWEPAGGPREIPATPCAGEGPPALWQAPPREFNASFVALDQFLEPQLPLAGFEGPGNTEPPLNPMMPQVLSAEPQPEAKSPIPDPVRKPMPFPLPGISPGRAKPVQVFPFALSSGGAILVPRSEALPLRPLMVLGPATKTQEPPALKPVLPPAPVQNEPSPQSVKPEPMQRPSLAVKIVGGIAIVLALSGGLYYLTSGASGTKAAAITARANDWIADFAPDAKQQRHISLLRSSLGKADYRVEFEGAIGLKALGWVYRARDAQDFYVSKIELQKPGENPVFAVTHFAVINGLEQPRVHTPLGVSVPPGKSYQIRFEAVGNRFTTWVQDHKVDEWTDDHIPSGGAGLFREGVEQFTLRGDFRVTPLVRRNRRANDGGR
jgi:hypothetical protein